MSCDKSCCTAARPGSLLIYLLFCCGSLVYASAEQLLLGSKPLHYSVKRIILFRGLLARMPLLAKGAVLFSMLASILEELFEYGKPAIHESVPHTM